MELKLDCYYREERGKNANSRLRTEGFIPAVVYGKSHPNIPIKLKQSDYLKYKNRTHNKKIITLNFHDREDKQEDKAVIIKDYAVNPLDKHIIHFDFYEFNKGEPISFSIPIHFKGQPLGVKQGGTLQKEYDEVEIECLPKDAIDFLDLDVSDLDFHNSIRIKDLPVSAGVKILDDPEALVASVVAPVEEVSAEEEIQEEAAEPELIKKGKETEEEQESRG